VNLKTPPHEFPELKVTVQGPKRGGGCRVAVYQLVDWREDLTFRKAERWGREFAKELKREAT
jgi:hypothetical protein